MKEHDASARHNACMRMKSDFSREVKRAGAGGWGGASSYSSSPGGSSGRRGGYGGSGRGGNSAWFRAHSPFDDTEEDRQAFNEDEEDLDEVKYVERS